MQTTAEIVADAAVLDAAAYAVVAEDVYVAAAEIPDHIAGEVVDEHSWAVNEPVQTWSWSISRDDAWPRLVFSSGPDFLAGVK
jgi:hypothetical protein